MDADDAIYLMEKRAEEFKVYHVFSINGPLLGDKAIRFMSPKWISALQSGIVGQYCRQMLHFMWHLNNSTNCLIFF